MELTKINVRKLTIYPEASVADPAHMIYATEVLENGQFVMYSDFTELKQLIHSIELKSAENAGYQKGVDKILSGLGMTFKEFLDKTETKSSEYF